ncbi:MAG: hypothetical protein R8M45_08205 [Ghiorsea sp.]
MAIKQIKKKDLLKTARPLKIKGAAKLKKTDLIHAIQTAEGNDPCFLNIQGCALTACSFYGECQA